MPHIHAGGRWGFRQGVRPGGAGGDFGVARTRLTLPPGRYLLEAYAASGVDGGPQHLDNHTVTVA